MPDSEFVVMPRVASEEMGQIGFEMIEAGAEMEETYAAMVSASPSAGAVRRERLREALDAARNARAQEMAFYDGLEDLVDRHVERGADKVEEDALAAALELQIAEE